MQENRYNTCDRFLGGLEKDFIITEQIEDSPLTFFFGLRDNSSM